MSRRALTITVILLLGTPQTPVAAQDVAPHNDQTVLHLHPTNVHMRLAKRKKAIKAHRLIARSDAPHLPSEWRSPNSFNCVSTFLRLPLGSRQPGCTSFVLRDRREAAGHLGRTVEAHRER